MPCRRTGTFVNRILQSLATVDQFAQNSRQIVYGAFIVLHMQVRGNQVAVKARRHGLFKNTQGKACHTVVVADCGQAFGTIAHVVVVTGGIPAIEAQGYPIELVLEEQGAQPYIIPAMGSHGGATAEGQTQILADYGITEENSDPVIADAYVTAEDYTAIAEWLDQCIDGSLVNTYMTSLQEGLDGKSAEDIMADVRATAQEVAEASE